VKNIWNENFKRDGCLMEDIDMLQEKMAVSFPKLYVEMMLIQNGGTLNKNEFECFDRYRTKKIYSSAVFLKIDSLSTKESEADAVERYLYLIDHPHSKNFSKHSYESIEWYLLDTPEFFPENLVPFAVDGGGNLTCFDYRNTKKDPPIVFWCHDDPDGEDVHFIANSFEEFINMLHEPTD
jgi:cell wall assembly regulator SMI1